ncbi:autotransporter outer membrane beta-barrel domain-containing protein, partial [Escherichia coli]|nr:autotransporter outer membrane beta-barrel domain-containing protein [Escherichia coli]
MNKAYSIVWNSSRQAWVVASELARGHGFVLAKNTLLVLTVASTVGNAFAQTYNCSTGQVCTPNIISSGDTQYVFNTGVTNNTVISGTGKQVVSSGGKTNFTTINDKNGNQVVGYNGSATNTKVSSGGFQRVSSGGTATGTRLSGGNQNVSSG